MVLLSYEVQEYKMTFSRNDIHTKNAVAKEYIRQLNSVLPCSLENLIRKAYELSPEIAAFCSDATTPKLGAKDKGKIGKLVEFHIFGRLPNNDSHADTSFGDCKATHVKKCADGYNAKERLTLTNCGATSDYANLQHIIDAQTLDASRCYGKIQTGILTVLREDEMVVALFRYDITELSAEYKEVIADDYQKIRDCVAAKAASQKGQSYLHIHPHGSKGSSTRAFGFTNAFVTRLISHYTGKPLEVKGRSIFIKDI